MKKSFIRKALCIAAAAAMTLSAAAAPSFAYIDRGDVEISGEDSYVLDIGETAELGVTPFEEEHYPGCQMPECPEICGEKNCIEYVNGQQECVCNGKELVTYYAVVETESSDSSVADAEYDENGRVVITAKAPGEAVISITADFREYETAEREVTVTVNGESAEEPDDNNGGNGGSGGGSQGGNSENGGNSGNNGNGGSGNSGNSGSEVTEECTVTFEANGGSGVASQTVESGQKAQEPAVPTKEGFTFAGWYTDRELTKAYDFGSGVTASLTLYAKWTEGAEDPEKPEDPENPAPGASAEFTDVSSDSWYAEYVTALADKGIVNGKTETEFAPNDSITRAEFVKIIAGIAGADLTAAEGETSFSDVASNSWYAPYVAWASENGVVTGSGGKFNPNSRITRQDMAVIIMRYVDQLSGKELEIVNDKVSFNDSGEISSYAADAVSLMQQAGIISGKGGNTFAPKESATRAEACKMLYMIMEQTADQQ